MTMRRMRTRFARRWRGRWIAGILTVLVGVGVGAGPASAGELGSFERTRYEVPEGTPVPRYVYDAAGNKSQDPACPRYPGLTRGGKVWSRAYIDGNSEVKIRFKFWTRYNEPVAIAKQAFKDTHGLAAKCRDLYFFEGFRNWYSADRAEIEALKSVACTGSGRGLRWCTLMQLEPGSRPVSVNPNLNEKCRAPKYNNRRWRGPTSYAASHNMNVLFEDRTDLVAGGIREGELPSWTPGHVIGKVYIDDYEQMGGVAWGPNGEQFRIATNPDGSPTYVGRGNVTTWGAAEWHVLWYDHQARQLGLDPVRSPRYAHQRVRDRIQANPSGRLALEYENLVTYLCTVTPRIADVIDAPDASGFGRPSDVAFDLMIRGWVDKEVSDRLHRPVNNYLCNALRADPAKAAFAPLGCQYWVFPWLLHELWKNTGCMNRPDNGLAVFLGVDLGCGRYAHIRNLMLRFRGFFG